MIADELRAAKEKVENEIAASVAAIARKFTTTTGLVITSVQVEVFSHRTRGVPHADDSIVTGAKIEFE